MLESALKNILHKHTWARKNKKKLKGRNMKFYIYALKKINLTHTGLAAIHVKGFGS